MLYAMLLVLFFPLSLLFSYFDQQQQDLEQGELQSILFYVDQLRVALPTYRVAHSSTKGEVPFEDLSFPLKLAERSVVKHYVDENGFYIVWGKSPGGLADALVKHYSRASGEAAHLIFYHIGFAEKSCLVPSRRYQQPSTSQCTWPLPKAITEGSLVITDREPIP
jgi:PilM